MPGSPKFKVYRTGEYIAACKYAEDAAALVAAAPTGCLVKYEHKLVVWTEGAERIEAADSFDEAGAIMRERIAGAAFAARERLGR